MQPPANSYSAAAAPATSTPSCPALNPDGPTDEELIGCDLASSAHGITVRHGRMGTNGELRFRLKCQDGTAYIRTQTTGASQGWQNPHFHKVSRETYIVERGWIGYAEACRGALLLRRYVAGQVFTTEPHVVHNIYVSANSVIHTVKHGLDGRDDIRSDWHSDATMPDVIALERLRDGGWQGPSEPHQNQEGVPSMTSPIHDEPGKRYNEVYRHFDNLIWQVPAWSTALFAVVVASVNALLIQAPEQQDGKATVSVVAHLLGMSTNQFAAAQLVLFGVFTLVLAYALHRFRWHQAGVKTWALTLTSPKVSPQTLLQALTLVEAGLQLLVACVLFGLPAWPSLSVIAGVLVGAGWWSEAVVRKQYIQSITPCRRATDVPSPSMGQGNS